MKLRINRKKLILLIIVLSLLIIEMIAVGLSRAEREAKITINAVDFESKLSEKNTIVRATQDEEGNYSLVLPEVVGEYYVSSYEVQRLNTEEVLDENGLQEELNAALDNMDKNATTDETLSEIEQNVIANHTTTIEHITPENHMPGETIILTEAEYKKKEINVKANFITSVVNGKTYYKKALKAETKYKDNVTIVEVTSYYPMNSKLVLKNLSDDQKKNIEISAIRDLKSENYIIYDAYDPHILYSEEDEELDMENAIDENLLEYNTAESAIGTDIKFSRFTTNKLYTLGLVTDTENDYQVSKVSENEQNGEIKLTNATMNKYIILTDKTQSLETVTKARTLASAISSAPDTWNGTTAEGFLLGSGTATEPYLISTGAELKYFADQVNGGNNFNGQYIKVVTDLNLGGLNWTPIGNANNPFRGNFDAQGHTISNGRITSSTMPNANTVVLGLFGAIGGGGNQAVIRNLALENITVEISVNGNLGNNDCGLYMGTVCGLANNNSSIVNVAVRNSTINVAQNMTLRNANNKVFIGGILGYENTNAQVTLQSCFADVDIDCSRFQLYRNNNNRYVLENGSKFAAGGIVGGIYYGTTVPNLCVYTGTIKSNNGFCGPIVGWAADDNNTGVSPYFNNHFELDSLGTNVDFNNYYYNYTVNFNNANYTFTTTRETLNATDVPNTTAYRASTTESSDRNGFNGKYLGMNAGIYSTSTQDLLEDLNDYSEANKILYVYWLADGTNSFKLKVPLDSQLNTTNAPTYQVSILNPIDDVPYSYKWYLDGTLVNGNTTDTIVQNRSWDSDHSLIAVTSDSIFFSAVATTLEQYELHITFTTSGNNITATIAGTGLEDPDFSLSDYTITWYERNCINENPVLMDGDTGFTIGTNNPLTKGNYYYINCVNSQHPYMNVYGNTLFGRKQVIYVSYANGNDNNNTGLTPQSPFKTMRMAYLAVGGSFTNNNGNNITKRNTQGELFADGERGENVIVCMDYNVSSVTSGTNKNRDAIWNDTPYFIRNGTHNPTAYNRKATITGKYGGNNYYTGTGNRGLLNLQGQAGATGTNFYNSVYRFMEADTTLMYLRISGYHNGNNQGYLYLQGHSLTVDEGVTMINFSQANPNQGLLKDDNSTESSAPGFHIFGGWLAYGAGNTANIPSGCQTPEILIKSGTYGRILAGGSSGTNSGTAYTHFTGTASSHFKPTLTVDIQNSTTPNNYLYDVNLLGGGNTFGSSYEDSTINIKNGRVGRVLGASIGDSSGNLANNRPNNTYIGSATINVTGGTIVELYGGCLGRNMDAVTDSNAGNLTKSDSFFYGDIEINISDNAHITRTIYGAGAGAISGYINGINNNDSYRNTYGTRASVEINITGGTIDADIYGGGYGFTEYLYYEYNDTSWWGSGSGVNNALQPNSGALYGDSTINISGTPIINGNIFGAGRGFEGSNNETQLAILTGTSTVNISGTPTISGAIYGAGEGINGKADVARLTANPTSSYASTVNIDASLNNTANNVFGGGSISQVTGNTNVVIDSGTQKGTIYGGGDRGAVSGDTKVTINDGTLATVYGGGNNVTGNAATNTTVDIKGGTTTTVYGGSNQSGNISTSSTINATAGTVTNDIFGGNNLGGTVGTTNINLAGTSVGNNVYGGGNQAAITTSNVNLTAGTVTHAIYGGGNNVTGNAATTTNVNVTGGTAEYVYGGSNQLGNISTSTTIVASGGNVTQDVFGGNNLGGTVATTNVTISGTTVGNNVYGGGNQAAITTSNVTLSSGTVAHEIYGGGNKVTGNAATTTNVNVTGGTAEYVYGGSNQLGNISTSTTIIASGGNVTKDVFGGNNLGGTVATTNVTISGTTVGNNVYGGGNQAAITTSNVTVSSGTVTNDVYGGGNNVTGNAANTTNVNITGGTLKNAYGGSNQLGDISNTTNVNATGGTISVNVYGGNNAGGRAENTNVTINGSTIGNGTTGGDVYGGGNQAQTGTTHVYANSGSVQNIYGAGYGASADTNNSNVTLDNNVVVKQNVYGGGNEGKTLDATRVDFKGGNINGNLFGGGNGAGAIVVNKTLVNMSDGATVGNSSSIAPNNGCVFAGGNKAATGVEASDTALGIVNVAGGEIFGHLYGGGNIAVTYGTTITNVGLQAITDNVSTGAYTANDYSGITKGKINIHGSIFGGGQSSTENSERFDYNSYSVTKNIDINVDGQNYASGDLQIGLSIFGSGNATNSQGDSTIDIYNLGTLTSPSVLVSVQRTKTLTIKNSSLNLTGITDSYDELHPTTYYSLNRIDNLKLANGSTLYLQYNANLLRHWQSLSIDGSGNETKASVTYTDPDTASNSNVELVNSISVRNNLYLYNGIQLEIWEDVGVYGNVDGMAFLGIYKDTLNPASSRGKFADTFTPGTTVTDPYSNQYAESTVYGRNKENHDIKVDGFYSNLISTDEIPDPEKQKSEGTFQIYIIHPTGDGRYYKWAAGNADRIVFPFTLIASKFDTLATKELSLTGFNARNSTYMIRNVTYSLLDDDANDNDIVLTDGVIPAIAPTEKEANSVFSLDMRTSTGWVNNGETKFTYNLSNEGSSSGDTRFITQNAAAGTEGPTPTLQFYLGHSQNITKDDDGASDTWPGTVTITLEVSEPRYVGDTEVLESIKTRYIDIIVSINRQVFDNENIEQSIRPGEQFKQFATTNTQIVSNGIFSTFDSVYIRGIDNLKPENNDPSTSTRGQEYKKASAVLVSTDNAGNAYNFNAGTKITMLDLVNNETYYYIVTGNETDAKYSLSNFIKMGSTNEPFVEFKQVGEETLRKNYDSTYSYVDTTGDNPVTRTGLLQEKYIFQYDFGQANVTSDLMDYKVLLQFEYNSAAVLTVLPTDIEENNYSLITNANATISVSATANPTTLYLGNRENLEVITSLSQQTRNGNTVFDTTYFDDQMGIKITILDHEGKQLGIDKLLGINFQVGSATEVGDDATKYYPRFDGSTRIPIANTVTNTMANILMNSIENSTLPTGDYTIKIETFGSPDGFYYGDKTSDYTEVPITIINGAFGLKAYSATPGQKLFQDDTLLNRDGAENIDMTIEYSSDLDYPVIGVGLQRRSYNSAYDDTYESVDFMQSLTDVSNDISASNVIDSGAHIYKMSDSLADENTITEQYKLKEGILEGTYRIVYFLYDYDSTTNSYELIESVYEYFIVM